MSAGPDLAAAVDDLRRASYGAMAVARALVAVREADELPPDLAALDGGWFRGGLETALVELLVAVEDAGDRIDRAVHQQPDAAGGGRG